MIQSYPLNTFPGLFGGKGTITDAKQTKINQKSGRICDVTDFDLEFHLNHFVKLENRSIQNEPLVTTIRFDTAENELSAGENLVIFGDFDELVRLSLIHI